MKTDLLIIGGGLAGLTAAYEVLKAEPGRRITILRPGAGSSPYVHGFNMPLNPQDSTELFIQDTEASGRGQGNAALVEELCRGSLELLPFFDELGLDFNREADGSYQQLRPLGASCPRVISIGNDAGGAILRKLLTVMEQHENVSVCTTLHALRLITEDGRVCGAHCFDTQSKRWMQIKLGFGISSLIGTGGRDLYPEIGGIMMLEGIRRLERDPDTKIIILVSKLADLTVMNKVLSFADIVSKPVVAIFLGADEKLYEGHRVYGTYSLEGAAVKAAQLLGAKTHDFGFTDEQIKEIVAREMCGYSAKQKYFRGLYCGGTFTEEGLIYYSSHVKNARLHSNLNTAYAEKLASHLHSEGHSILDLGSEEFTACSPHPVFDPEIRLKRFRQELQDDEVAVILLDFITGPGVAKEPVKEFAIEAKKAIAEKHITVISNICGSAEDPQNIELQAKMLRDAGVIVTDSNYQSARLAAALMSALNERG